MKEVAPQKLPMEESVARSPFAAADPAIGYLYQCRFALLLALQAMRAGKDFLLRLESLDDVEFDEEGAAPTLLQVKHHRHREADLTDASPDLWKTLGNWCYLLAQGTISVSSQLHLVTTARASEGSAAWYLRPLGRNPGAALERLNATAATSTNRDNVAAYRNFLRLNAEKRAAVVEAVVVLDLAPNITDMDERLRAETHWAARQQFADSFLSRLEGWWFRRAITLLRKIGDAVSNAEIEAQMDDLREQFKREALPIDQDILSLQVDESEYANAIFVKQLRLVGIGAQRVLFAIREYFRAFEQRSRWTREHLLLVGELDNYERRLVEEWEIVFERMKDDLGEEAAEDAKQRAAHDVYRWAENVLLPIRPNVTEPFVTRGSYQMLAEKLRVGWHPEFLARLGHLLSVPEVRL